MSLTLLLTDVFRMITWANNQQLSILGYLGKVEVGGDAGGRSFPNVDIASEAFLFRFPEGAITKDFGWNKNPIHIGTKHKHLKLCLKSHSQKPAGSRPWRRFPEHNGQ